MKNLSPILNNGTKFMPLVKEMYERAYCAKTTTQTNWTPYKRVKSSNGIYEYDEYGRYHFLKFVYVIYVASRYEWSGQVTEIGRGESPWLAWKNAFEGRVSREIMEKLES